MKGNNSASLTFIFVTLLIDVIGVGIIIPIGPGLVESLTDLSASEAALYYGSLVSIYALFQFVFSPLLGTLSDTFGRRPILLISLFGLGVDYLLQGFAPNITWLFIGRILAGMCGASHTVATAYVADISTPENKAKNFGMIGAAFGLGFIIGPLLGSFLSAQFDIRTPFFVAAGLSFLNFLYGYFILPESFPKEKRRKFNLKYANPIGSLLHLKKYPVIIGLIAAFFFLNLAGQTMPSIWVLFCEFQFGWDEKDMMQGVSLSVVGFLVVIVQVFMIGIFIKKFGEKRTVMLGFLFWNLGMLLFAFASTWWLLFLFMIPYCLGGIAGPTLQSVISNQVSEREQGELQGALTSLVSLTAIITPLIMTYIFHEFTKSDATVEFAGAPFIGASIFLLFSMYLAFRTISKRKDLFKGKQPKQVPVENVVNDKVL